MYFNTLTCTTYENMGSPVVIQQNRLLGDQKDGITFCEQYPQFQFQLFSISGRVKLTQRDVIFGVGVNSHRNWKDVNNEVQQAAMDN